MNLTPTTRGRHALRWVLAVGLVFVVVVGMVLQTVRSRAIERWVLVFTQMEEEWERDDILDHGFAAGPTVKWGEPLQGVNRRAKTSPSGVVTVTYLRSRTSGGNYFREWWQSQWQCVAATIFLRQERSFFGSSIEARMAGGSTEQVKAMTAIFAAVDVELAVEP